MAQNFSSEGVTAQGIQVLSYDDILSNVQTQLNDIYAPDGDTINFSSETPDGQFTNILAQLGTDVRELAQGVYNSFDPDKCSGSVQDSRYALNYIHREGGTFTIQNIDVTVFQTVTLNGLDANYNDLNAASYTVSDNAGNLWYLIDTVTLTAGTTSLPFRSQNYGSFQSVIGTITNQVTKVLGVSAVTNSVAPTTLGVEQETDAQFRIRRNRSTAIRGQNNYDAMLGQILELDGVTDANVWVNNTGSSNTTVTGDEDSGVPAYNVWIIVEGGANSDIAEIIYMNSGGLATFGYANSDVTPAIVPVSVEVPAVSGQNFEVKFNRAHPVPLYIRFDLKIVTPSGLINEDGIKEKIAQDLIYGLNEDAETSKITDVATQAILEYGGGAYALNVEISTDGTNFTDFIACPALLDKFVTDTTRITINTPS